MNTPWLLSCDWGTSSFRLYAVERESGEIREAVHGQDGTAVVFDQWQQEGKADRLAFYQSVLLRYIRKLEAKMSVSLAGTELILSGMASSSIGMQEVAYQGLPFDLEAPELLFFQQAASPAFPHPVYLFGGLSSGQDVMRGEEVQVLGLSAQLPEPDGVCILPGTHSKHIFIRDKQITAFKTFMTGEFFHLVKTHSILKTAFFPEKEKKEKADMAAFEQGVRKAMETSLLNSLFQIRVNSLLHQKDAAFAEAFLSGLLIGEELKGLRSGTEPLFLSSSAALFSFYKKAVELIGYSGALHYIAPEVLEQAVPGGQLHLLDFLKKINKK